MGEPVHRAFKCKRAVTATEDDAILPDDMGGALMNTARRVLGLLPFAVALRRLTRRWSVRAASPAERLSHPSEGVRSETVRVQPVPYRDPTPTMLGARSPFGDAG